MSEERVVRPIIDLELVNPYCLGTVRGHQHLNDRGNYDRTEWFEDVWYIGAFKVNDEYQFRISTDRARCFGAPEWFPWLEVAKSTDPDRARLWLSGVAVSAAKTYLRCMTDDRLRAFDSVYARSRMLVDADGHELMAVTVDIKSPSGQNMQVLATVGEDVGRRIAAIWENREVQIVERYRSALARSHKWVEEEVQRNR
ncbi:MAG: hypothetical protein BWY68_00030 [bacterium ADurb.Bin400]|nr:MAG: hypothetical protein BWY68_00030 [bacterium ADurb.Bin400]